MPALPLDEAGPYVAAAYLAFLLLIVVYVAIMAGKLARMERDIGEMHEILDRDERQPVPEHRTVDATLAPVGGAVKERT